MEPSNVFIAQETELVDVEISATIPLIEASVVNTESSTSLPLIEENNNILCAGAVTDNLLMDLTSWTEDVEHMQEIWL